MKKLKILKKLFGMTRGSFLHSGEQLITELFANVGIDEHPTNAPAAVSQCSSYFSRVIRMANHQGTPSPENLKIIDFEWAIGLYHFFEVLNAWCIHWNVELVPFFTSNQALLLIQQTRIISDDKWTG